MVFGSAFVARPQVPAYCAFQSAGHARARRRGKRPPLDARSIGSVKPARRSIDSLWPVDRCPGYPPIFLTYPHALHQRNIVCDAGSPGIVVVSACSRQNHSVPRSLRRLWQRHSLARLWITISDKAKIRAPLRIASPDAANMSGNTGSDAKQRIGGAGLPPQTRT
jgi:hypothetical protein